MIAERLRNVRPSKILELNQKAIELSASGVDVIDLGIGEPDFDTPEYIQEAAYRAMKEGKTRYTAVAGTAALRAAIVEKYRNENGLEYESSTITVTGGAKQAIFNAMMATLDTDDEVIIPAPYWSSYPDIVVAVGGTPVIIDCPQSQRFVLTPAQLADAITEKTKWLILNSPSNPTGAVYRDSELHELADVLRENPHVHVLSDDIYEHIYFDSQRPKSIAEVCADLMTRTLHINGVSKTFAMTGWRLGYAAGPELVIRAMNKIQGQSTSHACSISQSAALAALTGENAFISERRESFESRRNLVLDRLDKCDGLSAIIPEGAFYVFPNCSQLIGQRTSKGTVLNTDTDVCSWLLESYGVSVVPGEAFGLSPHIRISLAASNSALKNACDRIDRACASLERK